MVAVRGHQFTYEGSAALWAHLPAALKYYSGAPMTVTFTNLLRETKTMSSNIGDSTTGTNDINVSMSVDVKDGCDVIEERTGVFGHAFFDEHRQHIGPRTRVHAVLVPTPVRDACLLTLPRWRQKIPTTSSSSSPSISAISASSTTSSSSSPSISSAVPSSSTSVSGGDGVRRVIADAICRAIGTAMTREFAGARDEKDQVMETLESLSRPGEKLIYHEWDDMVGALDLLGDVQNVITHLIACPGTAPLIIIALYNRTCIAVDHTKIMTYMLPYWDVDDGFSGTTEQLVPFEFYAAFRVWRTKLDSSNGRSWDEPLFSSSFPDAVHI